MSGNGSLVDCAAEWFESSVKLVELILHSLWRVIFRDELCANVRRDCKGEKKESEMLESTCGTELW